MLRISEVRPRVVEIRRPAEPASNLSIKSTNGQPLSRALSNLRDEIDGLAVRFAHQHGSASETTVRAEQISHAIQRLQWALQRDNGYPPAG